MEWWTQIKNYPLYFVSDKGSVISFNHNKIRVLKLDLSSPYPRVTLSKKNVQFREGIHVLTKEAFDCERPVGMVCRHKDDVKQNVYVDNLEWGTQKENAQDAVRNNKMPCGVKNGSSILNDRKVSDIKELLFLGYSHRIIANSYGVNKSTIGRISRGNGWKHIQPNQQRERELA